MYLYKENSLKQLIKKEIISKLNNRKSTILDGCLKNFRFKYHETSLFKKEKNHASIFFQNIGKNSFITVLFKNRLIYNKSLGQLKVNNNKIKKKEKRMIRNLFSFSLEFTNTFFKILQPKHKIRAISVNYNCKPTTYYPFKKHFFYRLIGTFIRKNKGLRKLLFSRTKFEEAQKKMEKYKNKWYNPLKEKEKIWAHTNRKSLLYWYYADVRLVRLKSINFISKYPYNGCKKRKIRKI